MHITVPLAMFCLDAMTLNYDLCERAQNLKDRLIQYQVDVNRDTNSRYHSSVQIAMIFTPTKIQK
jgi:dynein heavy chain